MGSAVPESVLPDTFGLPEYFITDVVTEIDGPNVRMVCGVKRGGQVHWLYSCVMPSDKLIMVTRECNHAAVEAFNEAELPMGAKRGH